MSSDTHSDVPRIIRAASGPGDSGNHEKGWQPGSLSSGTHPDVPDILEDYPVAHHPWRRGSILIPQERSVAVPDDIPVAPEKGVGGYIFNTGDLCARFSFKTPKLLPENAVLESLKRRFEEKAKIVNALRDAGRPDLADRIDICHQEMTIYRCGNCGWMPGRPRSCDSRFCPFCADRRAARVKDRRLSSMLSFHNYVFLTLTFLSLKHITEADVQFTFTAWRKLWRRKFMQDLCLGAISAFEVSHTGHGFHPHLHNLIATKNCPLPIKEIRKVQVDLTGANWCFIERVEPPLENALRELIKYPLKPIPRYKNPEALKEYSLAIEKVQLIRGYGQLRTAPQGSESDDKHFDGCCPRCGVKGYLEKIAEYEPITNCRKTKWGWALMPGKS